MKRTIQFPILLSWGMFVCVSCCCGWLTGQDSSVDFDRDIKPILSDRCFLCHGPDGETREAGLRLDLEEEAMTVIEPGLPDESELVRRIFADEDELMPPPDSKLTLTDSEKQKLRLWIEQGAKWKQHWAFVTPEKKSLPAVENVTWPSNEIDHFVLAQLEANRLAPAEKASKEKLLRRIAFDLTGLAPTLDELDAALADDSDNWYEPFVDRYLASPRYGERMTADWLDVARYSDTYGYQVDRDRFVWPWRDWVVKAFNRNMPYDQFITEQIAGDLISNPTDDQVLATTFCRLHPQKVEGGSVEEEFRVEYVADRSQTVGMAFMGLTIECARCHDHKYDPISQKDYYQLFAYFNNVDESGLYSYFDPEAIPTPSMLMLDTSQKQQLVSLARRIDETQHRANFHYITQSLARDTAAAAIGFDTASFASWLKDVDARKRQALEEVSGQSFVADFEKTNNGNNELIDGPGAGTKGLKLTGDDEVKLEAGAFKRHQPFSIAAEMRIPNDPQILKRAVVFHRSRAWTDSASRGYQLLIEDGRLQASLIHFWPGNAISVRTKDPVATERWIHVTMVYDGSSTARGIQLFVDGERVDVEIVRDNLQKKIVGNGTDRLILGARFRDVGFKNGQIADLRVFDRELSGLDVVRLIDQQLFVDLLSKPVDELNAKEAQRLLEFFALNHDETYAAMLNQLEQRRLALNQFTDGLAEIMVMQEMPQPRPAFVLYRGSYDQPREPVVPGTPAFLTRELDRHPNNRLGLANWLTDPAHPLTARVAVNHYWQLCFGAGLVRTPEDFGSQGEPPTHPELLDWLAVDFVEHGWDVKRLIKQMVTSSTYRQSAVATPELLKLDPANRLLARAAVYRLPAEMLRDNVLAASGLLIEKMGGPPVRPYELEESFQPSAPDKGEGLYRRSLYTYWKRTGPAPVMLTLDAAKRDVCQVKRERTSSPLAALVNLNNPQSVEAARKLADRLINQHGANHQKLTVDMFRILTSRFPTQQEIAVLLSLYESQWKYFSNDEASAQAFLSVGELKLETEEPAELAAWASVANTLFSFDECVMKR